MDQDFTYMLVLAALIAVVTCVIIPLCVALSAWGLFTVKRVHLQKLFQKTRWAKTKDQTKEDE